MKKIGLRLTDWSLQHPKTVVAWVAGITLVIFLGAALPSVFPQAFPWLPGVKVDTDPENMLSRDEAVRVFHNRMKEVFSLRDMVVVGVVNEKDDDGVFNVESLKEIYDLAEYAKTLTWPGKDGASTGVVEVDLLAPSTVDNIEPGGPGVVRFEWLMPEPPASREAAQAIRDKAKRIPFLNGTLISEDGKAICLYLPLTDKHLSYRVYSRLREHIASYGGSNRYFITGLPVAEDTFGVEMFIQMAICAPLAMLVIFLLMLYFFRKLVLIASPLIVAFISVIWTMGLLIMTGNTIHIMSSMIPIFIMPIAVLDAIHIISMFFDRYQQSRNRVTTMRSVMETLFMAMLYTSLTTAAGFASLALTPIPPVQIFGLFAAFGIMSAWILTVTFIPAFVAMIPDSKLENFGTSHAATENPGPMSRALQAVSRFTYRRAWSIVVTVGLVLIIAIVGITRIRINDNPIRWFAASHPIRVADRVLNSHFGGTYMAYLTFEPGASQAGGDDSISAGFAERLAKRAEELSRPDSDVAEAKTVFAIVAEEAKKVHGPNALTTLYTRLEQLSDEAPDAQLDAWDEALLFVSQEKQRKEVFKNPAVLRYIAALQRHLVSSNIVGKSNSVADIVSTVYRELFGGKPEYLRIPDSHAAVAQCLITFQNSHRPQDLWHFITPDFRRTTVWLQLRSGDNRDMMAVTRLVNDYIRDNPPPIPLTHHWFGLTYINVIWQQKMVAGMLKALLGSFLVVFLMMTVLFRSALWGLLSMLPLSVTIAFTYGAVGLVGKDYDMPVAVLSSLSLGLAVDFAIHFLEHSRMQRKKHGTWQAAVGPMFGEPAQAIWRNIIVIAVGFLPLLLAPLVPYRTVGVLMATILVVAGFTTLLILPALIRLLERYLFPDEQICCFTCNCITCIVSAVAGVALVIVSIYQYVHIGWSTLSWGSLATVLVLAGLCRWSSSREKCHHKETQS